MRASNGFGGSAFWLLVSLFVAAALGGSGCGANAFQTLGASVSGEVASGDPAGGDPVSSDPAAGQPVGSSPELSPSVPDLLLSLIDTYQIRYPLKDTHAKLVNYAGDGFENLYGVRNFRAVLNGVAYRGGANNPNNKYGKKSNNNPLPVIGIENLCKEGFSTAVYLYPTNYASVPHSYDCVNRLTGQPNHLEYKQYNPTTSGGQTAILDATYKALVGGSGPVYLHCWNGWHASGLASAIVLRQFCGMSADAAVAYWTLNTDGAPVDSTYTSLKDRIRAYQVKPGYVLPAAVRAQVCPQ